jgi:hypothetical protein
MAVDNLHANKLAICPTSAQQKTKSWAELKQSQERSSQVETQGETKPKLKLKVTGPVSFKLKFKAMAWAQTQIQFKPNELASLSPSKRHL